MSTTPQNTSPTERENSLNGFTAVNGRGSPHQSVETSDTTMSTRPGTADTPSRPQVRDEQYHRTTNGDNHHQSKHQDSGQSVSPIDASGKRKRSIDEGDDDISDEEDESPSPTADNTENIEYGQPGDENGRDAAWTGRSHMDSDDIHLAQELRREPLTNGHTGEQIIPGERVVAPLAPGEYVRTSANVQVDPKRRKRAFTNRTKTGCQTCRKRKKKCDEGKPTCNNCERGGFVCEGYTQRAAFPRQAAPKQHPTPIQSKDSFPDRGGLAPRVRPNIFGEGPTQMVPDIVRRAPQGPQQPIVIDGDMSGRPLSSEWGRPIYGAGPTSRGYSASRYAPDFPPGPARGHMERASASTLSGGIDGMQHYDIHPSPIATIAQQSLEHMPLMSKPPLGAVTRSEKDKMRSGEEYNLLDPGLVRDRETCKKLLASFNTAGINNDQRQFQIILEPDGPAQQMHPPGESRLGKNVVVDTPFRCDYGYCLNIRDNVWIEAGCVITDAAEVKIFEGVHIGPDVKILSRTEPENPEDWRHRPPIERRARGIKIEIHQHAKIGAGVIIAPEFNPNVKALNKLTIGMNSRVQPGTIVRKNVAPNTVFGPLGSLTDYQSDTVRGLPPPSGGQATSRNDYQL